MLKRSLTVLPIIFEIDCRTIACTSETYVPAGTSHTAVEADGSTTLTMQGEYNKRVIDSYDYDRKEMYVISGDKIYHVTSDVEMKGLRCYLVADETAGTSGASLFSNARVLHSDGTSTGLRLIDADANVDVNAVYDLLGQHPHP